MSVVKDVKSNLKLVNSILPQLSSTDKTGSAVDTQDSVGVMCVAHIGTSGDTLSGSVKIEMEVQHSDESGSGFVACADADINAAVTGTNTGTFAVIDAAADDDAIYKCNYIGSKRYVKVIANYTGTHTNGCPVAAHVVLMPAHLPAT
jgi:hypothetical protein